MTPRLQRWMGISGIAFVVIVLASIFMVPSTPNSNASLAALAAFYVKGHQAILHLGGVVTAVSVVVGVFWFWYFRDWAIAANPGSRRLATTAFVGALLFAAGGALSAGIDTTLGDASSNHAAETTLQGLNYVQSDLNNGLIGAGVAIFLVATAAMVIRYRVLPAWLGWPWLLFAVAALVIGFIGMAGLGLWLIATNILLIRRARLTQPDTESFVEGTADVVAAES